MRNRVLIITGYTDDFRSGESIADNTMADLVDYTLPSKERYARKHGYDLLSVRSLGSDVHGLFGSQEIGFQRVLRTFEMLISYNTVMWLDADSIITNDNYRIEDFIGDADKTFYASYDWHGYNNFSCGNFIINKTQNIQKLINAFYSIGTSITGPAREEQTTLNVIHMQTDLKDEFKILEHKFLSSIPTQEMYGNRWVPPVPIFGNWNEGCFLAHLTGPSNKDRIEILNNNFERYLSV
jgi:hypothetical protein